MEAVRYVIFCLFRPVGFLTHPFFAEGTVKEDNIVDIQSIDVTPDPPQPGQNMTVLVKGTAKARIEVMPSCVLLHDLRTIDKPCSAGGCLRRRFCQSRAH